MTSSLQNHHIIPQELFDSGDFSFLTSLDAEFRNSRQFNLMGLPATDSGLFTQHNGSHPEYTAWVRQQIELID